MSVTVTGEVAQVRIEVRNGGPVIDCATLARIFDPLARAQNHRSRIESVGSLGPGLYIACEIAKAHHEAIEARSDDIESSFSVSLAH